MQDKKYLLSITELWEMVDQTEQRELIKRGLRWLDHERLERLKRLTGEGRFEDVKLSADSIHIKRKLIEMLGSGLLLQLAIMQAEQEDDLRLPKEAAGVVELFGSEQIIQLTICNLLTLLEQSGKEPAALEYTYGENGKPYFKNYPYFFNLSHSGEYIFCVISMQEVGVDIQRAKPLRNDRIAGRFFSDEEKQALAVCSTEQERQKLFYRMWACKEAYGKLTGQGVAAVLGTAMGLESCNASEAFKEIVLQEYQKEDYQIAVCKWKQES